LIYTYIFFTFSSHGRLTQLAEVGHYGANGVIVPDHVMGDCPIKDGVVWAIGYYVEAKMCDINYVTFR